MGIGNIFKAFQPKDKVFFVLFEKVANNLVEMSEYFHNGIKNFDFDDDSLLKFMILNTTMMISLIKSM